MKTKYLFTLALASSLAFAGCEDLDTMPSGGTVTSGQKEEVVVLKKSLCYTYR